MSERRFGPGRVNAHTHLYSGLAGLGMPTPDPEPTTFVEILERKWWRLDRALDAESLGAAARLYVAEALLEGTTGLIDHHESPDCVEGSLDVLADVCQELGMRAVLCYGATERNGGREEARRGLAECRRFVLENDRPLVRGVVGLHAPFTVSDATLHEAGDLARDLGVPLHLHLAEDGTDRADAAKRGYAGPVDRLIANDALPAGSLLAHGVDLTEAEVRAASERGAWFAQNPRSNHANRVGYPSALRVAARVALGTDGFPADMVEETEVLLLDALREGEDLDAAAARASAGRELLESLLPVGAEVALGHMTVGGRLVVEGAQLLSGDLDEIRAVAAEQAGRLWSRMERVRS